MWGMEVSRSSTHGKRKGKTPSEKSPGPFSEEKDPPANIRGIPRSWTKKGDTPEKKHKTEVGVPEAVRKKVIPR